MSNQYLQKPIIIFLAAGIVSACSDSNNQETITPVPTEPPIVNQPTQFAGSLVQRGRLQTVNYFRNGLYSASTFTHYDGGATPPPADSAVDLEFSGTNTQEVGVDEADRIEFDGNFMFVADYPIWQGGEDYTANVRVLQKNNDNSLSQVTALPLADAGWGVHGLYLSNENSKRLAVLSGAVPVYPIDAFATTFFAPEPQNNDFLVEIYNVDEPSNIPSADELIVQGRLISSRRIGDALYLVSNYQPYLEDIEAGASDDATRLENYKKILALPDDSFLPNVVLNGQKQALLQPQDCYIPERAQSRDGYAQIIQILKIDMQNPANMQAACVSAVTAFTYTSSEALYLVGDADNSTFLHKIALGDQVEYAASGLVPGIVGWNGQPHLRLSEWQQTMRIVTTDYQTDATDPLHRLFAMQQQGSELTVVGQLPNESYPEPLGKPGEDVFAVRYVGDRGYVVTFERIDPLYVIGLSDPSAPELLGQLEIPGFSSYLQPFGDDLLLGIGQQVDLQDRPNNGDVVIQPIPVQSMKVSLFDVRDPANPIEVGSILKDETFTPAEYDYRTLAVLDLGNRTRFALPTESWSSSFEDSWGGYSNQLMIFDVVESANPELIPIMDLNVEFEDPHYIYVGEDRSVLTTQGVFYLRANNLWFHSTLQGDEVLGPY